MAAVAACLTKPNLCLNMPMALTSELLMGAILGRLVGLATTDIADKYGQLLASECPPPPPSSINSSPSVLVLLACRVVTRG